MALGTCILFILLNEICVHSIEQDYDIQLERSEGITGDKEQLVDFSNIKITRRKRDYFFNGNFTFHDDMWNNYSTSVDTSYSPMGNNQFMRHPFRVPAMQMCVYINTTFRNYLQPMFRNKSNFPIITSEGLCPFPKGNYYVNDFEVIKTNFPGHIPRGLWKVEKKFFKNKDMIGGIRILGRIINK